jgi:hypothetical protein
MNHAAVEVRRFERLETRGGYLCTLCLGYGGREHAAASHWAATPGGDRTPICEQHARDIGALAEALAARRGSEFQSFTTGESV